MLDNHLIIEKKDSVATLFINRPEKKNAFTLEMWKVLPEIIQELDEDAEVKVLVIRGIDETAFAAGADISEFTTVRSTIEGEEAYNEAVNAVERAILNFSKPSIAMIQKYCIGGGCILALACDLRFSSESGIFAITPAKLGIIYTFQGTKNLVDLVGLSRAKDLLYSSRQITVFEAYSYGLVDRIFAEEEIVSKTYEYVKLLISNSSQSVRGSKKIINSIVQGAFEESEEIKQMIVQSYGSMDYQEGIKAFLEKRKPVFRY